MKQDKLLKIYQTLNLEDKERLMNILLNDSYLFLNSEKKDEENVQEIILRRLTDLESFFSNNNETLIKFIYSKAKNGPVKLGFPGFSGFPVGKLFRLNKFSSKNVFSSSKTFLFLANLDET